MEYIRTHYRDFPSTQTMIKAKGLNNTEGAVEYLCKKEEEISKDIAQIKKIEQKAEERLGALETFVPGSAAFEVGTEKKIGYIKMGEANYTHYRQYFNLTDREDNSSRRFIIHVDDTSATVQEEEPTSVLYIFDIRGIVGFGIEGLNKFPIGCYSGDMQSNVSYDCANREIVITVAGVRACEPITVAGYIDYLRA